MGSGDPPSRPRPSEGPVFWKELYWFTVLCLAGLTLALWALPPRLARSRSTRDLEADLRQEVAGLAKMETEYEAGIAAVENDPFYREEVVRTILKVKKNDEEYLKKALQISDN